ncbi:UDP-4-amino-4,6-dideoxy-N-acetyl-beta-L-altrosamine N-acetyltransferase [Helicobacter mesocricetorum]|uniref:UDP-4-amino-4, 6-dideoxy-N-acetyl-beta-L-altrosamine N-acetyltransferase n=1 Tax=Helicobacter mesocricetorum TaxID=87012 RepID=UPI0018F83FA2|nr:UDP-4-amino-4,6-dideoxy-N-acetyl-beta-L-altrosamine N-acetyltransferase [Helicobacter mesocricetorum]
MVLKDFVELNTQEQNLVYRWRTHKNIAKFMKSQVFSWEEHLKFLESLKEDFSKRYFLVFQDNTAIGVIDFVDICEESCEFGMYQSPDLKGFGGLLMQTLLDYAFQTLEVKHLYARALSINTKAISLYLRYGFNFSKKDEAMSYFVLSSGGGGK